MKHTYKLVVLGLLLVLLLQLNANAQQQVHRVQKGETLTQIAKQYGVWLDKLLLNNKYLHYPNKIYNDQLLVIPENENTPKTDQAENLKPQLVIPQIPSTSTVPNKSSEGTVQKSPQTALADLYSEFKYTVFRSGSSKSNKIALTFDDGPSEVTCNQALDILKQYNIKATFFLTGQNISKYPKVVARIVSEGHIIGGHSWSHVELDKVSSQ